MVSGVKVWRLLAKAIVLFCGFELALTALLPGWQPVNVYAALRMKRERLPLSTSSPVDDAQDVGNLDAMLASHVVSNPKAPNEYRVLVLGDSAVWGLQLSPEQTLPSQLNDLHLACGGRQMRFYNLSFPRSSATKDLMILDKALAYQPDAVVWLITWYTLMPKTRVDHWLVTQNPEEFDKLGQRFGFLPKGYQPPTQLDRLAARNRSLFREARFQMYSLIELGTGREQISGPAELLPQDLSPDVTFEELKPPTLKAKQVSLDQLSDFYALAGRLPVVLVNEPMQVVSGVQNSDVRYNFYYPRWVYDQYRAYVAEAATRSGWNYLDLWNAFAPSYFTDTPLHMSPEGQRLLAQAIAPAVQKGCP